MSNIAEVAGLHRLRAHESIILWLDVGEEMEEVQMWKKGGSGKEGLGWGLGRVM